MTGKESVGWLKQSLEENDPEVSLIIHYAEKKLNTNVLILRSLSIFIYP